MLVGYAGKVIDGKPALIEAVTLPENADIIIMIETEKIQNPKFMVKHDAEETEKRRAMVKSLKGCLAGCEINLNEIREERIAKRGLLE